MCYTVPIYFDRHEFLILWVMARVDRLVVSDSGSERVHA